MIKRLTALLLGALLIFSASAAAFGMERSIQPINDVGNIDNSGRSIELVWEGSAARAYYGSSGISVVTDQKETHIGTSFPVNKLLVLGDVNSDGFPDLLTYQNAPDHSAQLMTVSGRDGNGSLNRPRRISF